MLVVYRFKLYLAMSPYRLPTRLLELLTMLEWWQRF